MTALKPRPCVRDTQGRVWHVIAEFGEYLWLAPKPPDTIPWMEKRDGFERLDE
jgi:hypothetical protein